MNRYGEAALKAVQYFKILKNPKEAWNEAVKELFESKSSRDKGCPRGTFLALCHNGLIKGIPSGPYANSIKENKVYALKAIEVLKKTNQQPSYVSAKNLWGQVQDIGKNYNSQMDVVLALWNEGLIKI